MLQWLKDKQANLAKINRLVNEKDALVVKCAALEEQLRVLKAERHKLHVKVVKVKKEGRP